MSHILLVGTKSVQRKRLLSEAKIPFHIVEQNADESLCDYELPFAQLLESIAVHKMNHVIMPQAQEGNRAFVLTVDTMVQNGSGVVYGKPKDKIDAIKSIQMLRDNPGIVGTAFCLDKKKFHEGQWTVQKRVIRYADASFKLDIDDHWIEIYCEQYPDFLSVAGALTVETYGAQFLKSLCGSYSAALGLPMFELREALEESDFFHNSELL
jgi:septum formation protein